MDLYMLHWRSKELAHQLNGKATMCPQIARDEHKEADCNYSKA